MKAEKCFWLEVEQAVKLGLIIKMEEVSMPFRMAKKQMRANGTRICFNRSIPKEGIENVVQYIREVYGLPVEHEIWRSITVWNKNIN